MSLHKASKYLASKGRNGDSMLVHMSPGEVKGLQQLALAKGGSLTINPETGLPEAGILKSLIPMLGGAALMMIPGMQGFGGALAASAIMGGGMYAATGSLKEGLLAGLGAFGGANLAGGLAAAGADAAAATAETGADVAANTSAQVAPQSLAPTVANSPTNILSSNYGLGSNLTGAPNLMGDAASSQLSSAYGVSPQAMQTAVANAPAITPGAVPGGVTQALGPVAPTDASGLGGSFTQNLSNVGKGLPDIGKVVMASPFQTVGAAAMPFLANTQSSAGPSQGSADQENPMGLMSLSPNFVGYTPAQPNPYYTAQYRDYRKRPYAMAEGGIAGMADGGMNPMAPMSNTMYPQAQQEHTNFATSTQYPNSMKSAMAADYDTRTNPTTGQELPMGMASGGVAGYAGGHLAASASMPAGGIYRDTDPNTASKGAYEAAMYRLQKANKLAGIKTAMPKTAMTSLGNVEAEEMARGGIARYADGGGSAAASGDSSGVPAGMGGDLAGEILSASGLPSSGLSGLMGGTSAQNLAALGMGDRSAANLAELGMGGSSAQRLAAMGLAPAPSNLPARSYAPNYAAPLTPTPTMNYKFDTPIATAESIAREEAARKAAEEAARAAAAQQQETWGNPYSQNFAHGGVTGYNLGGYSDGGRMLKGPGDGMSDSIPASIGKRQPARLADGEFVVPADVVSHLGNGSTDAGAKRLYGMMDKVRKARTGTKKQGKQIKADKYLPT